MEGGPFPNIGMSADRLFHNRRDRLTHDDSVLSVQNIHLIALSRVDKHILKLISSHEIQSPGSDVMCFASVGVRESLENEERRFVESEAEPGSGQRLVVDAAINVLQEGLECFFFAKLRDECDEVSFST